MKRSILTLSALTFLSAVSAQAIAETPEHANAVHDGEVVIEETVTITTEIVETGTADLTIDAPYAYVTAPAQKNGAVFLNITNAGDADDRLIGVSSPEGTNIAERLELHSMNMDGDMMMMRKVDAIDIPAGQTVKLAPSGLHIMLIGLQEPLRLNEPFPLTLEFETAGTQNVEVIVMMPGEKPAGETLHHGDNGHHDHH